jgi:4a-hydroxytetrahydrobiopterin dehydratase
MTDLLSDTGRDTILKPLLDEGWAMVDGRDAITRTYDFGSFVAAMGWMTMVGIWAEKWNHHPEWSNVYGRVTVTLITHDVGGLSALDAKLARKMNQLAASMGV